MDAALGAAGRSVKAVGQTVTPKALTEVPPGAATEDGMEIDYVREVMSSYEKTPLYLSMINTKPSEQGSASGGVTQMAIGKQPRNTVNPNDYSVSVVVWEAKHLAGTEIDPYIEVQVGTQKKKTKTKKCTNDPVFEETFDFDFKLPPAVFMEQIITITVRSAGGIIGRNKTIGVFKIDLATVWDQPKHYFFHRWAMLIDELHPMTGAKGYVACDLIVTRAGSIQKIPNAEVDPDVEANILLPDDMIDAHYERLPARYTITVHSADGLPNLGNVAFASMRKYWNGKDPTDMIDPYVQISFAGQTGKTRVRKNASNPEWNEQIIFTELFPPLTRMMRVHVRDDGGCVVATAFVDMTHISDNSTNGYMPTFGPAYINLYGAQRGEVEVTPLNFGLGEGVCYRGRLLLSVRVELEEHVSKKGLRNVVTKNTLQLPEGVCGKKVEHMLFCSILKADMIDNKFLNDELSFELSFGPHGQRDDIYFEYVPDEDEDPAAAKAHTDRANLVEDSEEAKKNPNRRLPPNFPTEGLRWCSRTEPMRPKAQSVFFVIMLLNSITFYIRKFQYYIRYLSII